MQSNAQARLSGASSHVQSVNATSSGLIRSTLAAAAVAGAILTFVWLPAEYGIDPTGVGRVLGLTEMGQIKEQLQAEADADAAATAAASEGVSFAPESADLLARLNTIDARLAAIAEHIGASSQASATPAVAEATVQTATADVNNAAIPAATTWRNEIDFTLEPGEGVEIKLVMEEGAIASFMWSANGAVVNYDTHGDGGGQSISYEKGRSVPAQTGQLVAAFTGNHGWFWRNRTDASVVVTLRTRGEYSEIVGP